MRQVAGEINGHLSAFKKNPQMKDLVNEDCSINMRAFIGKEGRPYSKEEVKKDEKFVKLREEIWSGLRDEGSEEGELNQNVVNY